MSDDVRISPLKNFTARTLFTLLQSQIAHPSSLMQERVRSVRAGGQTCANTVSNASKQATAQPRLVDQVADPASLRIGTQARKHASKQQRWLCCCRYARARPLARADTQIAPSISILLLTP